MKKTSIILVVCLVLGLLVGCGTVRTAQYSLDCGATLTAAAGLEEVAQAPFTTTLQGTHVFVAFLDEHKTSLGVEDMTLETYGTLIASGNSLSEAFAENEYGVPANQRTADGFFYYICLYETGSSFWTVQFACAEDEAEKYLALFQEWSGTVELADTEAPELGEVTEEVYTLDSGVQVTLPDDMAESTMEGFDIFLHNNLIACAIVSEAKPEGWTIGDYAEALSDAYGLGTLLENSHGVLGTAYVAENEGVNYYYYVAVHESADAFWICQIFCLESVFQTYQSYIPGWASSLTFPE